MTYFTDYDAHLFHSGTHYDLFRKLGAHVVEEGGVRGVRFAVYAPAAKAVSVISDGNGFTPWQDNMVKGEGGVFELFVPGCIPGVRYKYHVRRADGSEVDKADPFAFRTERRPGNASVVYDPFVHQDEIAPSRLSRKDFLSKPMSVYEVHLGSWQRQCATPENPDGYLNYRTLADKLADYMEFMGYTHIEVMGIPEYPYDPSWGYQVTGYFAPTARYGTPDDFSYFVDTMHRRGFGVILDFVPAHFPKDAFGLAKFDGTPLYEYADPLRAEYPEWGTLAFDLSKNEVRNFLIASALFWTTVYRVDGLRVDAVASMLYNSFGKSEWRPNKDGGPENLDGFEFIRHLSSIIHKNTDSLLIAEDSTILQGITVPPEEGGFGFDLKWDMGWMNDQLTYLKKDPIYRKYHHGLITHTFEYVFEEQYVLVLSHDEVVYGKGSMYDKIPGNFMDKLGGLKAFYTMMMGTPGKKLLFMGQDFGQVNEWDFQKGLDWYLADDPSHRSLLECFRTLLHLYRETPVLFDDSGKNTFEWVSEKDADRSIFSFIRRNPWNYNDALLFVVNMTPTAREDYAIGAPLSGKYRRIFSTYSDGADTVTAKKRLCDGRPYAIPYPLRPYEAAIFKIPSKEK